MFDNMPPMSSEDWLVRDIFVIAGICLGMLCGASLAKALWRFNVGTRVR